MGTMHPSHKDNPVFHPKKSPGRVLQSQIDAAKNAYLWACSSYFIESEAGNGHWTEVARRDARRWHTAWITLKAVQRNA